MMDFTTFHRRARDCDALVLTLEIPADLLTPVGVFLRLGGHRAPWSFLFESVEGGEQIGRYSFIGVRPSETLTLSGDTIRHRIDGRSAAGGCDDPIAVIRNRLHGLRVAEEETGARLPGGWIGCFGYDVAGMFERLPRRADDVLGHPTIALGFYNSVICFDRVRQSATIRHTVFPKEANGSRRKAYDTARRDMESTASALRRTAARFELEPATTRRVRSNFTPAEFTNAVKRMKAHIRAGDIFQGVLSQRFTVPGADDSFGAYRRLRRSNPSPYLYYLRAGGVAIAGSSPETLVSKSARALTVRPIAGTRPRGKTPDEDRKLERQLLSSPKENAEHVMLVDLGRNDLGRVARIGTVSPEQLGTVERYSHVMHLVSEVTGTAIRGVDALDVLRATFPAGTLTGAPKIRAMEIIDNLEPHRRGVYGGGVGYIDLHGDMDLAIAIRTIVFDRSGAHVQAGAGIVADSHPVREYEETRNKAAAPLAACGGVFKDKK